MTVNVNYRSLAPAVALVLVSALLAVQAADLQRFLLPRELAGLSAAQLRATQPDADCIAANLAGAARKQTACADCTTVKACIYAGPIGWVAGKTTSCSGWTPWCNDGVCSATLSQTQSCSSLQADDTFQCTGNGYWPNLSSCSKYWMCTSAGAFAGDCSPYHAVYDPRTTLCVPEDQAPCSPISCLNAAPYQVLPSAPWMFAVCTGDDVTDPMVLECANHDQRYNGTNCVNACNRAGRFPLYYPDSAAVIDTTTYFECVAYGSQLIGPSIGKCPGSGSFDPLIAQCKFP